MSEPISQSNAEYYNSLPRKRSAVGVLIFKDEQLLVLEPTYKSNWLVPGGVVEKFESPLEAAIRECQEEIGIDVEIESFLCADFKRGDSITGDAIHYLFSAKLPMKFEIKIDESEIKNALWLSSDEAINKFDSHLGPRVKAGLEAIKRNRSFYCEDGQIKF